MTAPVIEAMALAASEGVQAGPRAELRQLTGQEIIEAQISPAGPLRHRVVRRSDQPRPARGPHARPGPPDRRSDPRRTPDGPLLGGPRPRRGHRRPGRARHPRARLPARRGPVTGFDLYTDADGRLWIEVRTAARHGRVIRAAEAAGLWAEAKDGEVRASQFRKARRPTRERQPDRATVRFTAPRFLAPSAGRRGPRPPRLTAALVPRGGAAPSPAGACPSCGGCDQYGPGEAARRDDPPHGSSLHTAVRGAPHGSGRYR